MTKHSVPQSSPKVLQIPIRQLQLVPAVALKLMQLTAQDDALLKDLTRLIETEPTLAAKVLRYVNSARYHLATEITSIHRAVTLLGFSTIRQIALSQLLYQQFITPNSDKQFNQLVFWQHCLFVAFLSKLIATALHHPNPDLVYSAALLHDVGKLILESHGKPSYSDFIAAVKDRPLITLKDERDYFGFTHAEVGHQCCREWQLPAAIAAVVAYHHGVPEELGDYAAYRQDIAIVSFANYIASIHGIGAAPLNYDYQLSPETLRTIDISLLNMDQLLAQVDREMEVTKEFYGIEFPGLRELRVTLVKNLIGFNYGAQEHSVARTQLPDSLAAHLTLPHQSLNPGEFVPCTLSAIQNHFNFDRTLMLVIDPKRRCLVPFYSARNSVQPSAGQALEINISSVSGHLLNCLRKREAVVVNNQSFPDKDTLRLLQVDEFLVIPVAYQEALIAVIYADNCVSRKPLNKQALPEILPIANELAIALTHARQYEAEKRRAELDPLTGLYNKRMIDSLLTQLFAQDPLQRQYLAVGFVDVDNFKLLNDTCGHQAGDNALKIVANILRSLTRPRDFIGRYGGEEFLFVLKNTDDVGAVGYAERIRMEIERRGKLIHYQFKDLPLTVSVGVVMYNPEFQHYAQMIEAADRAMYQAKREGRNKVVLFNSSKLVHFPDIKYA